ncbi:unnamed protein product [Arabis nemorensis]|uniref:Uncharacterized protein n=1 Tax=Arabis nemorensis TaxID=586526 RepID=A0A565CAZ5_9BRAS|nr:unnamed protein product [Arabis nemorensis]
MGVGCSCKLYNFKCKRFSIPKLAIWYTISFSVQDFNIDKELLVTQIKDEMEMGKEGGQELLSCVGLGFFIAIKQDDL